MRIKLKPEKLKNELLSKLIKGFSKNQFEIFCNDIVESSSVPSKVKQFYTKLMLFTKMNSGAGLINEIRDQRTNEVIIEKDEVNIRIGEKYNNLFSDGKKKK